MYVEPSINPLKPNKKSGTSSYLQELYKFKIFYLLAKVFASNLKLCLPCSFGMFNNTFSKGSNLIVEFSFLICACEIFKDLKVALKTKHSSEFAILYDFMTASLRGTLAKKPSQEYEQLQQLT